MMVWHATEHQWRAEAVGCPGPTRFLDALENIFYSSRKIYDDLFYQLTNFRTIRSLDAPSRAASCLGNYIFFTKTGPLDAPQGGCLGPSHRPHPPLHATELRRNLCVIRSGIHLAILPCK